MITYTWSEKGYAVDPQVVGELVSDLTEQSGGVLPPDTFVDAARPPSSPIHKLIEWDVDTAAANWQRHQARNIINSLRVVYTDTKGREQRTVAFYHVVVASPEGKRTEGYASLHSVNMSSDMHGFALSECIRRLKALRRRHKDLKELDDIWTLVDGLSAVREAWPGESQ